MTGKLSPDEMLRRLDIIAERRGQARQRRRAERVDKQDDAQESDQGQGPPKG